MGRETGPGKDPSPPLENRHGIPNLGSCIRCNLQVEGSGISPDDVVIEAGDASKGNRGPNGEGSKKDVGIRADRADGFVLRNMTVRHAGEHGIYVHETDGYMLDRFKAFYSRLYGTLTFASDHGVQQNCEAVGHGDSGIYPGGAPETGAQRPEGTSERYNQEIRTCDLHHNLAGYSGTNGNAVHVHDNNIYDNSLGIQTDVVTGAGHPGYPGDSALFENNRIYSNNFNPYAPDSDVKPAFPFPVGTGLWIAGGNQHEVRGNHFYDNWRRGTMLFSVPDSLVCGPAAGGNEQAGCNAGRDVDVALQPAVREPDGRPRRTGPPTATGPTSGGTPTRAAAATAGSATSGRSRSPPTRPAFCRTATRARTRRRASARGRPNELELIRCVAAFETRNFDPDGPCPWIRTPSEPSEDEGGGPGSGLPAPALQLRAAGDGRAARRRSRNRQPVPLGQATCNDWNAEDPAGQTALAGRVRAFAGGVVNDGQRDVGTGAVLSAEDAHRLFETSCSREYAEDFLLYKLYTHAAAFSRR